MLSRILVCFLASAVGLTLIGCFAAQPLSARDSVDLLAPAGLLGQSWPEYDNFDEDDPHAIVRGPGDYLAWWKLLAIGLVFVIWIKVADWMNKDACEMYDLTRLTPGLFNPINLIVFFLSFLLVITVPWFFVGFPLYLIASFFPFVLYVAIRNKRVDEDEKAFMSGQWMRRAMRGQVYRIRDQQAAAEIGPDIEFAASGDTGEEQQSNLIRARQAEHFPAVKAMMYDAIKKRASTLMLDYTQESAQLRMEVDGFWHLMATMDRVSGDSMLHALKHLGNLNPKDRRSRQESRFEATLDGKKSTPCEITTQGVPTGEKVVIKIQHTYAEKLNLAQIGMWPDTVEELTKSLNSPGIIIVSAPPGAGLSTTWMGALAAMDRIMRDCITFVDPRENETVIENVTRHELIRDKQGDIAGMSSLLLKNPEVYVLPELVENKEFLNVLIDHVVREQRTLMLKTPANSAIESFLRVMQKTTERQGFASAASFATCQRLVRRLCDACKQPMQPNPNFLQQLGAQPGDEVNVCAPYQLPPESQRVDEKGNPIEIPPCHVCNGLGYIGRIAVVESVRADDKIRQALAAAPKLDTLTQLARKQGNLTMVQQGYRLVLAGVTSIQEIQRVFQQKKKP